MANTFVLILTSATFITGLFWCVKNIKTMYSYGHFLMKNGRKLHGKTAENRDNLVIKNKNNDHSGWIEIFSSIFPVLLLVFIVRSFIFEPFQIPSGSMMPTLLVGDFILVNKFVYGIKDPITQTTLIKTGHPKRGDVVVFKYPPNPSLNYIKRVVGLPNDRISYDRINKQITVQPGYDNDLHSAAAFPVTYFDISLNDADDISNNFSMQYFYYDQKENNSFQLTQRIESFNKKKHNILIMPNHWDRLDLYFRQPGKLLSEWVVPKGEYFMMGDNRDNSNDSRYWGFVPDKNLVGKATTVWISFNKKESQWPTGIRFNRIGNIH